MNNNFYELTTYNGCTLLLMQPRKPPGPKTKYVANATYKKNYIVSYNLIKFKLAMLRNTLWKGVGVIACCSIVVYQAFCQPTYTIKADIKGLGDRSVVIISRHSFISRHSLE